MKELKDIQTIYFIGIGGIGMSALARYFLGEGIAVHGYDKTATPLTRDLEKEGMVIHYTEDISYIPQNVDLVVYTPAVPASHAELVHLRQQGVPVLKRAEVLGLISRSRKAIAVAGTHGKTTTSCMVTHLLRHSGVDCSAFLGGISQNLNTNFILGKSSWVVIEADEYDRSFLHLTPELACILSLDADHLDIYGSLEAIIETGFRPFVGKIKPGGSLWAQHRIQPNFPSAIAFGIDHGTVQAQRVRVENGRFVFDYIGPTHRFEGLELAVPGRHNIENACAAISLALAAGANAAQLPSALASFRGVKRRFEEIYRSEETVYIDDYGHHPAELKAVFGAARELYPDRKITAIFQPHLYSRTRDFVDEFAEAMDMVDEPILLDIYPAREEPLPGVDSAWLLSKIKNNRKRLIPKSAIVQELASQNLDVLLTLGAGDIDGLVAPLRDMLNEKTTA